MFKYLAITPKYQNKHSSIGTSFKYYLGNKDYSQKQVGTQGHQKWGQFGTQGHWKCGGHRDTENVDKNVDNKIMLGHRDTKNADNLGHRDTETVDIKNPKLVRRRRRRKKEEK